MLKMNPTTGKMDVVNSRKLLEYTIDPPTATSGDNWLIRNEPGTAFGLLLALTNSETKYVLSIMTQANSIIRQQFEV